MTKKEFIPLLVLMIFYSIFTFYNLGNMESPQTVWNQEGAALFDFGEVRHISRFQFMMSNRNDVDFMLFTSVDGNDWNVAMHISDVRVFAWDERTVNEEAFFAQIVPFNEGLRIQEIAFRDENNQIIPINVITPGAEVLVDEPHTVPERSNIMNSTYFDEIFHARSGYELLHGLTVFETTHPPMGKNFIAMGAAIFGMTPFGWRFPGALMGVLMIPLMYAFGRMMFKSPFWGIFTAFIFSFDFMLFVQTRIATIDSYVTIFIIASYLCMYGYTQYKLNDKQLWKPLLFLAGSGLFIGLAVASKWQGIYALIGLPIIFFPHWYSVLQKNKKLAWTTFASCFAFFLAIPITIYLLAYIPFVYSMDRGGGFFQTVIDNQISMFSYHSGLLEWHPFASRWWEWAIMTRPMFYYSNTLSSYPDVRQGISSFGNPAIWWVGIAATAYAIVNLVTILKTSSQSNQSQLDSTLETRNNLLFLLVAYGVQFVPWIFVPRSTFIYHYFPSVPFVVLLITFMFQNYKLFEKYPRLVLGYAVAVFALFLLFFPVLSASPVAFAFVETFLRWFTGWILV
ncbi:MAG: phospholipid carrier-dependent glycosyltransferase [Firmicutes bacterium]|nr:phospholipid carrier-dependent glycosyltransferase [Bacillota bacterium]